MPGVWRRRGSAGSLLRPGVTSSGRPRRNPTYHPSSRARRAWSIRFSRMMDLCAHPGVGDDPLSPHRDHGRPPCPGCPGTGWTAGRHGQVRARQDRPAASRRLSKADSSRVAVVLAWESWGVRVACGRVRSRTRTAWPGATAQPSRPHEYRSCGGPACRVGAGCGSGRTVWDLRGSLRNQVLLAGVSVVWACDVGEEAR